MNKSLPVYELFQAYILSAQRRSDFPLTAAVPEAVLRSSTTAGGRKPEIFCGPGHCGPKPTFVTNPYFGCMHCSNFQLMLSGLDDE